MTAAAKELRIQDGRRQKCITFRAFYITYFSAKATCTHLSPLGVLGQRVVVLVEQRVREDLYLGARERRLADHAHQLAHVHAAAVARC